MAVHLDDQHPLLKTNSYTKLPLAVGLPGTDLSAESCDLAGQHR